MSKRYRISYTPCRHKGTAFPVINIDNQMLRLAIAKIKHPPKKLVNSQNMEVNRKFQKVWGDGSRLCETSGTFHATPNRAVNKIY